MVIGWRGVTHLRHPFSPFILFPAFQFLSRHHSCISHSHFVLRFTSRVLLLPHSLPPHPHSLLFSSTSCVHTFFFPLPPPHTHPTPTIPPDAPISPQITIHYVISSLFILGLSHISSSSRHSSLPRCLLPHTQSILLATRVLRGIRVEQRDCFTLHPFLIHVTNTLQTKMHLILSTYYDGGYTFLIH